VNKHHVTPALFTPLNFTRPAKRAKTDASLKGWKKETKEAKGKPVVQQAILDRVDNIIKSTYRVLLSRGRKGCYVWCKDVALSEYLKQRLALAKSSESKIVKMNVVYKDEVKHPIAAEVDDK